MVDTSPKKLPILPSTKKKDQTPSIKRKIYREIDFERHAKKLYYDALRAAQ